MPSIGTSKTLIVNWTDAKAAHNRPEGMAESASEILRLVEESLVVLNVVKDQGKGEDERHTTNAADLHPSYHTQHTDAVYSASLTAQCFDRAYLSNGAKQLNVHCGFGICLGIFSRKQDLLVSLFTRFENHFCRAQRKKSIM